MERLFIIISIRPSLSMYVILILYSTTFNPYTNDCSHRAVIKPVKVKMYTNLITHSNICIDIGKGPFPISMVYGLYNVYLL